MRSLNEVPAAINQLNVNLTADFKGTRGKKPSVTVGQSRDVCGLILAISSDTFQDSTQGHKFTTQEIFLRKKTNNLDMKKVKICIRILVYPVSN